VSTTATFSEAAKFLPTVPLLIAVPKLRKYFSPTLPSYQKQLAT
jgi:hypothetical protein